jgi:hypothetical protein
MANGSVKLVATEVVSRPVTVKFKTKSGETVSIKAIKTFERKVSVGARPKKKSKGNEAHLPR